MKPQTERIAKAELDPLNKWAVLFSDEKEQIIGMIAIPPTDGDRVDVVRYTSGVPYGYDIEVIVVEIRKGEPTLHVFIK